MDTARTKRFMLAELIIFLTLAGTTALAFQPIMALINKNIVIVREGIIKQAEELLDRPIRYGSLAPSIISTIEIREFTVGDKADPLVAAEHLYIEYSIVDLIRGKGIGAIRNLILNKPVFSFDTERDGGILELFSKRSSSAEKPRKPSDSPKKLTLPPECLFDIREGRVSFVSGNSVLSVGGVFLNGEIRNNQISMHGVWQKDLAMDGVITMEGGVSGSFSGEFDQGSISVNIDSIEGEWFTVDRIGFVLSFFEDRIVFEREADGLPLELSAEYLRTTGGFSGLFHADRFVPSSIIHFRGPLERFDPVLSLRLSGKADLVTAGNSGSNDDTESIAAYHFLVSGEIPQTIRESPVRSFVFEGDGNNKQLTFSQFVINAYSGFARYTGDIRFSPLLTNGTLVFSDFSLTGDTSANGSLFFAGTDNGQTVNASYLSFGETVLASLGAETIYKPGGGDYSFGFTRYREGESGALRTSFESRGFFTEKPDTLEGTAVLNGLYADDLINMVRPFFSIGSSYSGAARKTAVTAKIDYKTDFRSVEYTTGYFQAVYGGNTTIQVSVQGSENSLELTEGLVRWPKGQVSFGFYTDFSNAEDLVFLCNAGYLGFNYNFEGRIRNKNNFTLRSDQGFSAAVLNEEGRWSGSLLGSAIPMLYRGTGSYLNLAAALEYRNPDAWNLSLSRFEIQEGQGRTVLFAQGQANQNGMNMDRIFYTDRAGPLGGSAAAIWNSDFSFVDASFILTDPNETEKIAGDIFYESGNLEFQGNITNFKGERITAEAAGLRFTGEMHGGMSGEGYYLVNLSLKPLAGRLGENDFSLTGHALLDPEKLILSQINFSAGGIQSSIPYLSIDRNAGLMETEAMIYGIVKDNQLGMLLSLGANFQPMRSWLDFESLGSLSGIIDVQYAYINDIETNEAFRFVFTRNPIQETGEGVPGSPSVYRISGGTESHNMLDAEFRENKTGGVFSVSLRNPFPAQGVVVGFLDGTTIDAFASEVFIDMAGLWELLPMKKIVYFTGGIITGEARMFGSIYDPEFDGTAWGTGITLLVPDFIPVEIGPGSGVVTLEGSGFYFGPVDAPCGNGHGILNASINFNRWLMSLDMTVDVDTEIPFDFNISGVMAKGNAKGTLNFVNEEEALFTITGQVDASDTEITVNKDEIERAMSAAKRAGETEIAADVLITAGKRVEFLWPNARTPLLRAYGESITGVQIIADTRVPMFAMDGNISLRGGELYHFSRSFYIREGQLNFKGNDINFDPLISVRAEIRDNNDDGPVTIFMVMENVPLSELDSTTPRYEAIPSLSQMEIYSLLGLAPPIDATVARDTFNPFLKSTTEIILQTVVFRPIEQRLRNILGLDMFSLRTQILQNAVFETVRDRNPGEEPATMGNYLDNTAVFIGKYFGPDLFGQAMLAFRYDPYQKEYGGMKPELNFGLDLRSPLFDVRWNAGPLNLERFYIGDFVSNQSISLIWRWSL